MSLVLRTEEPASLRLPRHALLRLFRACILCVTFLAVSAHITIREKDLDGKMLRFTHGDTGYYTELLFDIHRYQLIVGARDHLFRLSLEDLKKLEDVAVPASNTAVRSCLLKGQTEVLRGSILVCSCPCFAAKHSTHNVRHMEPCTMQLHITISELLCLI